MVASIVALAAAAFAQPELLGADVELIETAEGVEEVSTAAEGGAAESSGLRTISDISLKTARAASVADAVTEAREGNYADAGIDGALAFVPGLGDGTADVFGIGDRAADAAALAAEQANDVKTLINAGLSPTAADSLVFADGDSSSVLGGIDQTDRDAVSARASELTAGANAAARTALRVGRPVVIAVDTVVQDPVVEIVKAKVSPTPVPAGSR